MLYREVLLEGFAAWTALVDQAIEGPREGWPQVERMLQPVRFFEERPDFVRLVRWEALEGGPILHNELNVILKPLFEHERRSSNARWTLGASVITTPANCCSPATAVLSYLSDGQLMSGLLDADPLSAGALADRREHVLNVLRTAVALEVTT